MSKPTVEFVEEPEVGDLAFVVWRDATGDATWTTTREARRAKPQTCMSVGWVLVKNKKRLTLVDSKHEGGNQAVGGRTVIPRDWLVEILPLEIA